jgi:hypothetical protein
MDHLIAGERSPKVLAQIARRRACRKISQLEEALEGAEFSPRRTPPCWPRCWPHRPAVRRHRGPDRSDRTAAGPV